MRLSVNNKRYFLRFKLYSYNTQKQPDEIICFTVVLCADLCLMHIAG